VERHTYECGDGDGDGGYTHRRGDSGCNHVCADREKRERKTEKEERGPPAPSDLKNLMERTIPHQAQELTQLHLTVRHLANLMDARAAYEEAQRWAMMLLMQEREQKWDTCHEDNKLCGADIMNMIVKTMKGVAQGQEERER